MAAKCCTGETEMYHDVVTKTVGGHFANETVARAYCAAMLKNGVKVEAFTDDDVNWYVLHVSGDFGLITDDAGRVRIPALQYWYNV